MNNAGKFGAKRSKKKIPSQSMPTDRPAVPAWLAHSAVYQRLPMKVRKRVDAAILLRPTDSTTLKAIDQKFKLSERYRISPTALRTYAQKLERLVRPALVSQVLAEILGCLPEDYRRRLLAGSQVLLLSRVTQVLSATENNSLPVADLAKLASVLSAFSRSISTRKRAPAGGHSRQADQQGQNPVAAISHTKIAQAVRMLYGLSWPPVGGLTNGNTKHR